MYIILVPHAGISKIIKIGRVSYDICAKLVHIGEPVLRRGGCKKYDMMHLYHSIRATDFQTAASRYSVTTLLCLVFVVVVDNTHTGWATVIVYNDHIKESEFVDKEYSLSAFYVPIR